MSRLAALTVVVFALSVAPAWGSGGTVGGDAGPLGVTANGLGARYVAQHVQGGTLLEAIDRDGGAILNSRFFHRNLMVPAVAFRWLGDRPDGRRHDAGARLAAARVEHSLHGRRHAQAGRARRH